MRWRRSNGVRPVVRMQLASSEEAFEGILVGRWDGHYRLDDAKLISHGSDGQTSTYRMDGRFALREDRVIGYQVVDEVHPA